MPLPKKENINHKKKNLDKVGESKLEENEMKMEEEWIVEPEEGKGFLFN